MSKKCENKVLRGFVAKENKTKKKCEHSTINRQREISEETSLFHKVEGQTQQYVRRKR
jgi:hypothetical protein